ncbi:isoamyl acetate-hydrolyzing esterase 1 homolog isoform X2 [Columba livia]|uniref:isoamyl acetate-hydrolyzing esterase 1 homolog isoform X2 n=1 Tax=Columba livia TaxID=8932 RepID=UPI0031BB9DE1
MHVFWCLFRPGCCCVICYPPAAPAARRGTRFTSRNQPFKEGGRDRTSAELEPGAGFCRGGRRSLPGRSGPASRRRGSAAAASPRCPADVRPRPWRWRRREPAGGTCSGPASSSSETPSLRKCDVVNRGFSGYNTRWAKLILPRLITKSTGAESTVAVIIFFGANDSALKDLNPKQHVPLEEYAENLKSMIRYLKSVDVTEDRVILITPPPLHEPTWEKECLAKGDKLNRHNATTGEYAQACVQAAMDCGTDVIDLWTLMQKNEDFSSYLSDGLHLSTQGNSFLAAQLWSRLEKKLSAFPTLLPYWRDVDHTDPAASLL